MDKLEVGMYAYSNFSREKGIGQIIKIDDNRPHLEVSIKTKSGLLKTRKEYVKASYNPIDLIEVGDYVNGECVTDIDLTYFNGTDRLEKPKRVGVIVGNGEMFKFSYHIKNEDIKSIVTKEQFDSMKYEIGG